jgi:hypothetical protein
MREHTVIAARKLVEARIRKMVPTHKAKAIGDKTHSLSQVVGRLRSRMRSGKAKTGTYSFQGVKIHVDMQHKQLHLECPHCGQAFDDYIDFADHQDSHTSRA